MQKNLISLFALLCTTVFLSSGALAEKKLKDGVFQAYWKAEWNESATVNTPQLKFRYLPIKDSLKENKVINIIMAGSEEEKIEFIKNNFHNIPANFLKYKEWYVNQKGDLTVKEIEKHMECNTDNYTAAFVSFFPDSPPVTIDANTFKDTGCNDGGSFPYLTSYVLKPSSKTGQLRQEPGDSAKVIHTFTQDDSIAKIKTIDEKWMYVSLYDYTKPDLLSDKKGYIKFSDVTPLN
ncbi:hypothetical protein [Mixta intestinalis]|uniref:SH3b domain-containing protein n=1 Tax=Mixta intestinalis TaxID=1615494 RepID=A0A6P1Q2Z5_9GAMM|nr:hypothetical protein [Mixta intestinalis]QHM72358.1 hypothetical protein C7M51_02669 [Mixta intestinalis]